MSPENQVTDGDSGVTPEVDNTPKETQPETSDTVETKEKPSGQIKNDAAPKPAETPRKTEARPDNRAKPKAKEEVPQPVSTPKASEPKSLAEVMKVDLRVRRRRRS